MYSTILSLQSRCMWFENHKKLELVKPISCAWCPFAFMDFSTPFLFFVSLVSKSRGFSKRWKRYEEWMSKPDNRNILKIMTFDRS